ncbi:MAG: glycosyltransferase [Tetrasphaera sp.]|nr:glycosyltransferase [Tetrasphaera sp.]
MPVVSIVVPTRGGAERIPRLLRALRAQEACDWEAIFVLDGDIDDSAGVLAAQAADLPVRVVVFPENRGRAAALNAGFAAARGSVLVRCDDDVEPAPDFAAAHAALHADRRIGIVGPCRDVFEDTAYARAYGLPAERRVREHSYALAAEQGWRLWSGNVSVTREVYDEVGEYDTDFREYGWEDVDWGTACICSACRSSLPGRWRPCTTTRPGRSPSAPSGRMPPGPRSAGSSPNTGAPLPLSSRPRRAGTAPGTSPWGSPPRCSPRAPCRRSDGSSIDSSSGCLVRWARSSPRSGSRPPVAPAAGRTDRGPR